MNKCTRNSTVSVIAVSFLFLGYQNCGQVQNSMKFSSNTEGLVGIEPISNDSNPDEDTNPSPDVVIDPIETELPPEDTVVCGGLGEDDGDEARYGIQGSIFTSNKQNDPKSAVKYATHANPVRNSNGDVVSIFLNNINVPERRFNQGFYNLNGDVLQDGQGNTLIEYFGLKLNYTLTLPIHMKAGYYHIAIESDDGAVLKVLDSDNSYKTIIDNDGQHATQTKCTSKAIYLDHTTQIPSELYYYQGPREHIALRLAWKSVRNADSASGCGPLGAADGEHSTDQWSVIPSIAFKRSGYVQTPNPCVQN